MGTATEAISATGVFVHEGLFYRGTADYLAGTLSFVEAGLTAGEPVLVAVPGANLELIRSALNGAGGQVRFADMADAGRNPGRIIPWVLHAFITEHAGRRPRIIGEPIWAGRSADEYPACAQHEALINAAFTGVDATILCPYDADRLTPEVLADAIVTHPILVERGRRSSSTGYAPLDLVAAYNRPLPEPDAPVAAMTFTFDTLFLVRRFVAEQAARAGLPRARIDELQIAVNELSTNSVNHGGGTGAVRVWHTADVFVCEVGDRGRITDPLAGRLPPGPTSERGRGLVIVHYLCDLVRVHSDDAGTTVRLHVYR